MYWSLKQMLVHHTVTGCNMRAGDLIGTGTISGSTPDSCGSLLEITWRGTKPLQLDENVTRKFLEDGDTVTMTGNRTVSERRFHVETSDLSRFLSGWRIQSWLWSMHGNNHSRVTVTEVIVLHCVWFTLRREECEIKIIAVIGLEQSAVFPTERDRHERERTS